MGKCGSFFGQKAGCLRRQLQRGGGATDEDVLSGEVAPLHQLTFKRRMTEIGRREGGQIARAARWGS